MSADETIPAADDWMVTDCGWRPVRSWSDGRPEDWYDHPAERRMEVGVQLRAPLITRGYYTGAEAVAWMREHYRRGNRPRIPYPLLVEAFVQHGCADALPVPLVALEWWPAYKANGVCALGGPWLIPGAE